jgi:hypothetical protein
MIGAMFGFAGNLLNLAGQDRENIEANRRFKLQAEQAVGAARANAASSGIETIGGASPGAQKFLETMDLEFTGQLEMMKQGQRMAQMGGFIGAVGSAAGGMGANAFQMADLNKSGATFTPKTSQVPNFTLSQSDFVKGALTGPSFK